MNTQDAKFILRAHRNDGRYRPEDPLFAEALAKVRDDAGLTDWLAHEQSLDNIVANKIDGIQPPAGLREAILIGAKASRRHRSWWQHPTWLAAAAAVAMVAGASMILQRGDRPEITLASLAEASINEYTHVAHNHLGPPAMMSLEAELGARTTPMNVGLTAVDANRLKSSGCHSFTLAGHEVFEVCFVRDSTWYHLYVTRGGTDATATANSSPYYVEHGELAAAAWSDGTSVFTLLTKGGIGALKKLI